MGWPLCWVLQGFWVGIVMQVRAGYRFGQWRGYWQWAFGGLGSGSGVKFVGKWFQNKLLGLFHYFFSTTLLGYKGKDFFLVLPW